MLAWGLVEHRDIIFLGRLLVALHVALSFWPAFPVMKIPHLVCHAPVMAR